MSSACPHRRSPGRSERPSNASTATIRCRATTTCAPISEPAEHDLSKSYEFVANTFGETARSFGPALNVNTLGEVPDSSWFTNRIGQHDMTVDEVLRGPNQVDGPAPGEWLVTGRPSFRHHAQVQAFEMPAATPAIKLNPVSSPELPSSVELISTKLFHAIGYHVPQDFVVHFHPGSTGSRARRPGSQYIWGPCPPSGGPTFSGG